MTLAFFFNLLVATIPLTKFRVDWPFGSGDFSTFSSGGHLVYRSEKILAILIESHPGNIPVKMD